MYKKVILGVVASVLALSLANFGTSARALDCVGDCEEVTDGYVWAGEPTGNSSDNGVTATSDDVVVEETDVEEEETEEEPPMWPVYLSLGAIGVTFLLVIIINLSGRKYDKK